MDLFVIEHEERITTARIVTEENQSMKRSAESLSIPRPFFHPESRKGTNGLCVTQEKDKYT